MWVTPARQAASRWRVVVITLLACLLFVGCTSSALYSDLDEQQANEVMAALMGAGISADKEQSATPGQNGVTWTVKVGSGEFPKAMQVLNAHRLPRPRYVSMCETFKKEGFASSSIEEHARYQCSRENEIAKTISDIPGVAEARVHIVLPERDPLGNETNDSSASVTVYELPGASVRSSETDIKAIVKDSVEGLDDVNKVTVKFYPLGGPQAAVQTAPATRMSAAGLNPMVIAIIAGGLALLAIAFAVIGRLRARRAAPAQPNDGRIWNG